MSIAQRNAQAIESERLRARIDTLEAQVDVLGQENARLRGLIPTQHTPTMRVTRAVQP